jgi:hypothetical protein
MARRTSTPGGGSLHGVAGTDRCTLTMASRQRQANDCAGSFKRDATREKETSWIFKQPRLPVKLVSSRRGRAASLDDDDDEDDDNDNNDGRPPSSLHFVSPRTDEPSVKRRCLCFCPGKSADYERLASVAGRICPCLRPISMNKPNDPLGRLLSARFSDVEVRRLPALVLCCSTTRPAQSTSCCTGTERSIPPTRCRRRTCSPP